MAYAARLTNNLNLWEQTPACHLFPCTYFLPLDFLHAFLRFNVQSTALSCSFWTSSVYSSASTSNPPRRFFPFGLLHTFPPLQRPIHHAASSLLDFLCAFLCFNIQSTTQFLPFWTSSVHSSASTSNPPLFSIPFGLPPCIPLLQRPILICTLTFSSIANILIANFPTMCV